MGIVTDELFDRFAPRTVNVYIEICEPVTDEQMAEIRDAVFAVALKWPNRMGCAVQMRRTPGIDLRGVISL